MVKKAASKNGKSYRVTFELPAEVNAQTACLCGDFNEWHETSLPMKRRKDGSFSVAVTLPAGQSHHYRYLLDGERWENDWAADSYVPNIHGGEDSVVEL